MARQGIVPVETAILCSGTETHNGVTLTADGYENGVLVTMSYADGRRSRKLRQDELYLSVVEARRFVWVLHRAAMDAINEGATHA